MAYRPPATMADLRAYVTGPDGGGLNQAESTVLLHVTHSNLKARFPEIRLDLHMTVDAIKTKLMTHTGTNPSSMTLVLKDETGRTIGAMSDDWRPLGFYSPYNGCTIHVVDNDPTSLAATGWLEDTSKVEKYVMSDAEYNARDNTYRKWKEGKLKEDPTWTLQKEMAKARGVELPSNVPRDPDYMKDLAEGIAVGSRCIVDPGDKRGEVRFVGLIEGLPAGYWVGVQLDEPLGKNDGTVKDKKIFECPPGYGLFVRPDKVTCGDYPPIDPFDEELDEL